jgi:hypothetical protein
LLTQGEILEKETLPPANEADQHAEAEPDDVIKQLVPGLSHGDASEIRANKVFIHAELKQRF